MERNRQNLPYFATAITGSLGSMSSGTWKEGWSRRAYVDLGPYRVRQLLASDQIGSAIEESGSDPELEVRIGHYLFWRWALAVSSNGHTERQGAFSFLFHSAIISVLFMIVGTVLGLIWGLLGLGVFGLWCAHMFLNFSARFGSSNSAVKRPSGAV